MAETPPPTPERQTLAIKLETDRHEVVTEWMNAVRDDPQIPDADRLTFAALQDHLPELLAELIGAVRDPATLADAETVETALAHGKARWRNGYRLDEVLRELSRVREIILARIRTFCRERACPALRDDAEAIVRRFFDTVVVSSVRQFMREQEAEMLLRSRQLENAYEQVQAATEQLREVAQSRLRLLRGVAHELRNALQAVSLGAESLLHEAESEGRDSIVSRLSGNAHQFHRLLARLQEFSTILAGESRITLDRLEVEDFIHALEKPHRLAAERKGLIYRSSAESKLPPVTIDAEKLRHIADILISNAVDYTNHGSVDVMVRSDGPDRWILSVEDTGAGLDEADARHVFHEFHRSERTATHGVGLGLVIAKHLAHLIDAEITFRSQAGVGTRFDVNLPIALDGVSAPSGPHLPPADPSP